MKKLIHLLPCLLLVNSLFFDVNLCLAKSPRSAYKLSRHQWWQLDFFQYQVRKNKEALQEDWNTNLNDQVSNNVQLILSIGQLLVQTAPDTTKQAMKQQIINLFKQNAIAVTFTDDNQIIKTSNLPHQTTHKTAYLQTKAQRQKTAHRYGFIKKKSDNDAITHPQKIHGARSTLKRVKARWGNQSNNNDNNLDNNDGNNDQNDGDNDNGTMPQDAPTEKSASNN